VEDLFDILADGTVVLRVHVQPGARRSAVVGRHGDAVKVAVREPADRGKANDAVLALLRTVLGAPVELVAGTSSRSKRVAVPGLGPEAVRARLAPHLVARS
jgi:uncharacterized protein (TIGR00251 family)